MGIPLHTPGLLYKVGLKGYTLHGHVFEMEGVISQFGIHVVSFQFQTSVPLSIKN